MRTIFVTLFFLVSLQVSATELWGGAHAGMTLDEVRAAFPKAGAPLSPGVFAGGRLNLLEAPGPELAGKPFLVEFVFDSGSLDEVLLRLNETMTISETAPVVSVLRSALTSKYGEPVEWVQQPQTGRRYASSRGLWRHDGVLVTLLATNVGDTTPVALVIRYSKPSDASNL